MNLCWMSAFFIITSLMRENNRFLIDLNLAVRLNNSTAFKASSKINMKVFMTISALKGEHYNFVHNLKSFFWVLFWICVHWHLTYTSCSFHHSPLCLYSLNSLFYFYFLCSHLFSLYWLINQAWLFKRLCHLLHTLIC